MMVRFRFTVADCRVRMELRVVWNLPKNGEEDVDPEVSATAGDEENAKRRDWMVC